jgi:hypothetical protein
MALVPEIQCQYNLPYDVDLSPLFSYPNNPYISSLLYQSTFNRARFPRHKASSAEARVETQGSPGQIAEEDQAPISQGLSDYENVYEVPFRGAEMVDHRIANANIVRWTSAHSDNAFLQKLLVAYFLYEYPFFPLFHKDLMMDDMIIGRNRFCSSLLVNAILAAACVG